MDLSKLSDEDLLALKSGDLSKVSDDGLMHLKSASPEPSPVDRVVGGVKTLAKNVAQDYRDVTSGAMRGAGSIGATLLAPADVASDAMAGRPLLTSNRQRRADMDSALQELMGANPNSLGYGAGKLGGEIAGTAGVGPALGVAAKVSGAGAPIVNALTSGGFRTAPTLGPVANTALRTLAGSATGGASAGLVNPEEAGTGALIGGALPVAAKVVGKAGEAVGDILRGKPVAPEVAALADRAQQLGIEIPADRIANSKPLNAVAAGLNYIPGSGRAAVENRMQEQLDRALTRTFGQNDTNVTKALRQAQNDLGSQFDTVLKNNTVKVDPQFLTDLADSANKASRELGSDGAGIIGRQVDDIVSKASTGEIDGQAAYNIKKTLDRIGQRNSPEAFYARDLKKSLMAALDRSLGPDEAAAFKNVRQQYGNMLDLEGLAQNGAEGGLSMARVANMKNINNPDLQELADIAAQFLKPREGAHGAAQRAAAGIGLGAAGGLKTLGASVAAGRGLNMLLDSQAARNSVLGLKNRSALDELLAPAFRAAPVLATD